MTENKFCEHFHIDCGSGFCWAVVDRYGKHTLPVEEIKKLVRPTLCGGNERMCDFKKVGGLK